MITILNYINGQFLPPVNGRYIDNIDPATGTVYGKIAASDNADVELAVQAAQKAFPVWSKTDIIERSRVLRKLADLILENIDELAAAESQDNGKPLTLATSVDIPRAARNFE
ncbi:MAG TPA: 2-hydroxymuconic semialdehyde dehydrogenase, partial [Bacteroidetes bacterium]|nr:2-hydroxymuconic semialdehyde dehydrogenase [Bacteroidota bacterium]